MSRTDEDALDELSAVTETIGKVETRLEGLRASRIALFLELRDRSVTFARIASAAGVTEAAVHQAMRKARKSSGRADAPDH